MNVAVVGAGIAGASAARHLAERGHATTLFEQFALGHTRGSSHGNSRIVRRAYPDPYYTECMLEAYPLWAELEAVSGTTLLDECGLLYFGDRRSANIRSVHQALRDLNVDHRLLDRREARNVFPQLMLEDHEVGVYTPEAGWVHAAHAVQATLQLGIAAGVEVRPGRKADREMMERDFDMFVVCAGPWARDWAAVPVRVTLQTFGYVHANVHGPVWIEDSRDTPYGFPSEGPGGFKIGIHRPGMEVDPDQPSRTPEADAIAAIEDTARHRFGIRDPRVENAAGCLYTSTANEDFLFGRLGEKGFFASACSGHGFKFGPWVGKLLADFVEGKKGPESYPRFHFV